MSKILKAVFICGLAVVMGSLFGHTNTAQANERITGTFVKADFDEIQVGKDTVKQVLSKVTIKNDAGRTITLAIDDYAKLSIDSVTVKIDAFKLGMKVEADVNLRKVKFLRGKTDTSSAVIEPDSKIHSGTVSYLNRNLKGLSVKLDDGRVKNVYVNSGTVFYKNNRLTDISSVYEGDRVKIKFSTYNSNYITTLEILNPGVQVAGLYKGTLQRIDPVSKKIILRDETQFLNWHWVPTSPGSNTSYHYSAGTPIYLENRPVTHNDLRKFANHKVYYATISKHGKEQVERIIIQKNAERTYYEPLKSVNRNYVNLADSGRFHYHDGSILIRNGRLVDPEALGAYGTAFVAATGPVKQQYANVIHISNDGMDSPNLAGHELYFGRIDYRSGYEVDLYDVKKLVQNQWVAQGGKTVHFNNESSVVKDFSSSYRIVLPNPEFREQNGSYGYFYVKDGQLIRAHIVAADVPSRVVAVGRLESFNSKNIYVRNVSQWQSGSWATAGRIHDMNIQQTTFIKEGRVIQLKDLRANDRLYIVADNLFKGRIILVD